MWTRQIKALLVAVLVLSAPVLAAANDAACQEAIDYSASEKGLAVYVLKNGELICEGYSNGGSSDRGNQLWSGTKSFNGIIAAAAVQDGLLNLDELVSKTLPEWNNDPQKATITIRHLLSLTSGLERGRTGRPANYSISAASSVIEPPGTKFIYSPTPFQVFGAVMKKKLSNSGRSPDVLEYLQKRVLDPIGIKPTGWKLTNEGDPLMPHGSEFTAKDWAKFGEFIRAGGVINGKNIVDPQAFAELFRGSRANPGYGLSWWLVSLSGATDRLSESVDIGEHEAELPKDMVFAAGAGNQRLYIVPSQGLTIVRMAKLGLAGGAARSKQGGGILARIKAKRSSTTIGDSGWSDFRFVSYFVNQ
ncbi:MAG: beta-lactamase family protein [Candidatus Omnitrophica bacterium]|nr:beta-lactamase family protein [Candidatus Omnitrophota bacterium]